MSWLLAIALFAIGIFLMESSQFIGFLTILAGVFALLLKPKQPVAVSHSPPQAPYYAPPVVIKSGGHPPQLEKIKLRVKEGWTGTTVAEDFFEALGNILLLPAKIIWRLLRIGRGKQKESEKESGRK